MLKHLGLIIVSLGFMCAYAAPVQTASAPVEQATAANAVAAQPNADDSTDPISGNGGPADQASADMAAAQSSPAVVTVPMIFQVGKQKLEVNRGDVVQISPTDEMCTDGVAVLLTDAMGNQLHALTAQNQNQNLKILWNGMTLGDAAISTPIGASLCIGYVDTATAQALVSEFAPTSNAGAAAGSASVMAQ